MVRLRPNSNLSAARRHNRPCIPTRLIDGLRALELITGKVGRAGPHLGHSSSKSIAGDDRVPHPTEAQSADKAPTRGCAIAAHACSPRGAAMYLGSVDAEQAHPLRATEDGVTIHHVSRWAIDWHYSGCGCGLGLRARGVLLAVAVGGASWELRAFRPRPIFFAMDRRISE
jgi:hypothetical protein